MHKVNRQTINDNNFYAPRLNNINLSVMCHETKSTMLYSFLVRLINACYARIYSNTGDIRREYENTRQ
jgi:hypothetical protein